MVVFVSDKNFSVVDDEAHVIDSLKARFESDLSTRAFRMDKDKNGFYISELTQSAWLGFSLCCAYFSETDKPIGKSDSDETELVQNKRELLITYSSEEEKEQVFFLGEDADIDEDDDVATNVEDDTCVVPEPIRRSFKKILYPQKNDAVKKAISVSKERCIPMWVHPANGEEGWHISSHGFAISRRPDIPVTMSMLDERQIFYGFSPSGIAKKIQPSVVARIAYAHNGSAFTQNSEFFNEHILMEWVHQQDDPALVISFDKLSRDERSERRAHIQDTIKEILGRSSYYRWITRDTVVIAVSHDKYDYGDARERIQNPHWMLKTMSWPNTFIMKKVKG